MSERLVVDSVMTADGEVVPLGPVDKDGHRVPLDTTSLYGSLGEHYKVKSFVHFPLMDGWFMECAFTHDLIDDELYDERLLPYGVQVYCPDNGGALRLTYDLQMEAVKGLREDSTLCLLWAMLMDSYSRWRTTGDVFNEASD